MKALIELTNSDNSKQKISSPADVANDSKDVPESSVMIEGHGYSILKTDRVNERGSGEEESIETKSQGRRRSYLNR